MVGARLRGHMDHSQPWGKDPHSVHSSRGQWSVSPLLNYYLGVPVPQGCEDWKGAGSSSWHTSEQMLNTLLMKAVSPMPSKKQTKNQQVWATISNEPTASELTARHWCCGLHRPIFSELCTSIILLVVVRWLITQRLQAEVLFFIHDLVIKLSLLLLHNISNSYLILKE